MDKVYPILGKVFLALILLSATAYAAIYLNQRGYFNTNILNNSSPTSTPTSSNTNNYNLQVLQTPQTVIQTKTVTAGLDKSSGLSFTKYQLQLPTSWTDKRVYENTEVPVDTLTLTKGNYTVKIFQAATGGALCLYPGDADFEGPSSKYDNFINITTLDGTSLRRSGTTNYQGDKRGFTACQKSSDDSYQQPTIYGHISITTPLTIDTSTMAEIDTILSSLKKI